MTALIMMFLGAGVGIGALLFVNALRPTVEPLDAVIRSLEEPGVHYGAAPAESVASPRSAVIAIGRALMFTDDDEAQLRRDLAITGSSLDQHALVKAGAPALVALLFYALWLGSVALRVGISGALLTFLGIAAVVIAFLWPDVRLRSASKRARSEFRHALSAYFDLVTIVMSGGGGLSTALHTAADAGDGWAFGAIRAELDRARLSNREPWAYLGELGDRFDIPELSELVSATELAGGEGARITESVATKADVLRARLQAEVEEASESMTEQMLVPVALLLVALFLFLGYAVFQQFSSGATPLLQATALPNLSALPTIRQF